MDVSHFILESADLEMLVGFFRDIVTVGIVPGFMITTVLHLLGYGVFKALSILNIRS